MIDRRGKESISYKEPEALVLSVRPYALLPPKLIYWSVGAALMIEDSLVAWPTMLLLRFYS